MIVLSRNSEKLTKYERRTKMLYEVAIIEHPTKKQAEKGKGAELVFGIEAVVANTDKTAAVIASQKADLKNRDANRLEVLVRPFAVQPQK